MRLLLLLLLPLSFVSGCTTTPAPAKTIVIPPRLERAYDNYHYAPAVRVGDTVIVSGIPAGPGEDYEARVRAMFKHLKTTLEAAGATLDDVVEINTFHVGAKDSPAFQAEFKRFLAIHKEYFTSGYPAWTAVGTTALLADGAPVEMRAVAVIGSGKHLFVQRQPAAK
jgi:enamine deaminase RidA (YjgF/YER057c/UK114 family)